MEAEMKLGDTEAILVRYGGSLDHGGCNIVRSY